MRDELFEELLAALLAAKDDLESTAGLLACDNDKGKNLFCICHSSLSKVRTAIFIATRTLKPES